jgi:hypothetical protein
MANEIWAAIIQAVPVIGAAGIGWYGLNTWRRQLREGRQIKHAEKARSATDEMFAAIRTARLPGFSISEEDFKDRTRSADAIAAIRDMLLKDARDAWRRFQDYYVLARLYADPVKQTRHLDVAREVERCISRLEHSARAMRVYEPGSDEFVREWRALRGSLTSEPDEIEILLRVTETAWKAELESIVQLRPSRRHRWARLKAAWHRG